MTHSSPGDVICHIGALSAQEAWQLIETRLGPQHAGPAPRDALAQLTQHKSGRIVDYAAAAARRGDLSGGYGNWIWETSFLPEYDVPARLAPSMRNAVADAGPLLRSVLTVLLAAEGRVPMQVLERVFLNAPIRHLVFSTPLLSVVPTDQGPCCALADAALRDALRSEVPAFDLEASRQSLLSAYESAPTISNRLERAVLLFALGRHFDALQLIAQHEPPLDPKALSRLQPRLVSAVSQNAALLASPEARRVLCALIPSSHEGLGPARILAAHLTPDADTPDSALRLARIMEDAEEPALAETLLESLVSIDYGRRDLGCQVLHRTSLTRV